MKKKIYIILAIIIILACSNLIYYNIEKNSSYENVENYIEREFNNNTIEIIESNDYYYILGYGKNQNNSESIVYFTNDEYFRLIKQDSKFYVPVKEIIFVPHIKLEDILVCTAYRVDSDYFIIAEMVIDNREYIDVYEYAIYDSSGEWQSFERTQNEGRTKLLTFFTAIEDIKNYNAYLKVDGIDNILVTGDELVYFCTEGTSHRDVQEYYKLK